MRLCMVTTFYPPYHYGGDAIFVRALARALVRRGHEVEVVHCRDAHRILGGSPAAPADEEDGGGVVVHTLHSPLGILSPLITQQTGAPGIKAAKLRSVLDRGFDVVNFHNVSLVGGPAVLAMSHAPVTLYTLHEHWLVCPTHTLWKNRERSCDRPQCLRCCLRSGIPPQLWRHTGLVARSLAHVDALLSPSAFTAERHRANGIATPIRVLPTFAAIDPSAAAVRPPPARPRFLYVGRVTAAKGVAPLLEQVAPMRDVDLWIAGEGDLLAALRRRWADSPNVRFLGAVAHRELADLYRAATAVVVPSLAPEVFPLAVIEAFACGTPAIVHDAGGSREAVDRTGGGLVYRTSAELRAVVRTLAADPELRDRLAQRARAGYLEEYCEPRHLDRYLDLIAEIAERKAGAPPRAARRA